MKILQNTIMMPLEGTMDKFTGGLYESDGKFVTDSLIRRGSPAELLPFQETLKGTYIYGGCLFAHFGHFIWESLTRLDAILKCKNYPIVFISPNDYVFNTQKLFFKTLGIKNDIIVIRKPTIIENIIYSSPQSSLYPANMSDSLLSAMAMKNFTSLSERRVWLSRTKLKYGKILNEEKIESYLRSIGFEIIYPEKLPLLDQIKLVSTSRIVSGFIGSQFFSAFFAKSVLGHFILFNRRVNVPDTIPFLMENKHISGNVNMLGIEVVDSFNYNIVSLEPEKIVQILSEAVKKLDSGCAEADLNPF